MITVLLDSSMSYLCVGIADENKIIDSISYEAWQKQSENLIPELDKMLKKHNFTREDIKEVMVTIGPGSFTGTRIALTTAKIFSVAIHADIIPVSTLQSLKDGEEPSICLLDARSGRSYFGVYKGHKCIEVDQIKSNEEVKDYIALHPDYKVRGKLKCLGLMDNESDVIKEMFSLRPYLEKANNPLAIKPSYMKE